MERKCKWVCPECGHRSFVRYVDGLSGEYVGEAVGKCDRAEKCGYHLSPRDFFESCGAAVDYRVCLPRKAIVDKWHHCVPVSLVDESMMVVRNNFGVFARECFGWERWLAAMRLYRIGGVSWPEGGTVFWQIDYYGDVRTGKVMLYDYKTGRRVKDENRRGRIGWMHSRLEVSGGEDFRLKQCLFGEHLLREDDERVERGEVFRAGDVEVVGRRKVCVVEAEKTAVICSMFLPEFIWLATGGLYNLSRDRCRHLRGRDVILYPDLGAYDIWRKRAAEIPELYGCRVSVVLEEEASDAARAEGLDLADFVLQEIQGRG